MFEIKNNLFVPNVNSMLQSELTSGILYPPIDLNRKFMLPVSALHKLYVEVSGSDSADAIPVVVLHGGPGAGAGPNLRRYFDPQHYKIVLFDQRGAARSTPFAELKENSTWDLVEDMERIRCHLDIDKWLVFGGSWGATLALCYAIKYPGRVIGLVGRGIFMGRPREIEWFYGSSGAANVFPEKWDEFVSMPGMLPDQDANYYISAYQALLNGSDQAVAKEAAKRWAEWESYCDSSRINLSSVAQNGSGQFTYAFSRIENHYFANRCFFDHPEWILNNITEAVREIPFVFAQGRFDMDCPRRTAWDLKKRWPESEMVTVPDSGHSASEPGVIRALVAATDWFAYCIRKS